MTESNGANMETNAYTKMTAEVYDAIYSYKDYESEAEQLVKLIGQYKKSDGNDLLDVACGTGAHLPYLVDQFDVTGIDLSPGQIEEARKRLPGVDLAVADMMDFDIGKQFDVVTCLFSSIGYAQTTEGLESAVLSMSKHLKPGGVLIIEPWLSKDKYDPNHKSPPDEGTLPDGTKVKRTAKHGVEGNISVMVMHHELDGPNGHSEFDEEHRLAMYSEEEFQQAFQEAGLSFGFNSNGLQANHDISRGVYIGVKRPI